MSEDNVAPEVVARRVRNRIIEYLEVASSFEDQREYRDNCRRGAPFVHVPSELINRWEDWVREPIRDWHEPPVYSDLEVAAMERFHAIWVDVAGNTPDPQPELDTLQQLSEWKRLRQAAEDTLRVFMKRGTLPED